MKPEPLKGNHHFLDVVTGNRVYDDINIRAAVEWLKVELKDAGIDEYDPEDSYVFEIINKAFEDVMKNDKNLKNKEDR